MAVKIRLRRTGRKKQPSYRLVVADTDTPRDGQYLDAVGTYNPLTRPADLRIDLDKVDAWLARGAGMTDTVASLIRKARQGGDRKVAVRGVGPDEPASPPVVAPPPVEKPKAGSRGAPKAAAPEEPAEAASGAPADNAIEAPSAPADDAIEAPSAPADDAIEAPSAPADDAIEAPSAPADDPIEAPSAPADDAIEAPSAPADDPIEAPSAPADDPIEAPAAGTTDEAAEPKTGPAE
jgi:small subunit ribosomal protein S16